MPRKTAEPETADDVEDIDDLDDADFDLYRCEDPDWEPLEMAVPIEACADFMFMAHYDGLPGLKLYKHRWTRRYLNLRREDSGSVRPYRYLGPRSRYELMDWWTALDQVFWGIEHLWLPDDSWRP